MQEFSKVKVLSFSAIICDRCGLHAKSNERETGSVTRLEDMFLGYFI
jgi:hypothetical protein